MDKRIKLLLIISSVIVIMAIIGAIIYGLMTAESKKQTNTENKLVQMLPYETDEFKVEHGGDVPGGEYTISLYAILNGDSQLAQYNIDLKQYKQDSIKWLNSQGVNLSKMKIIWLPEEATNL